MLGVDAELHAAPVGLGLLTHDVCCQGVQDHGLAATLEMHAAQRLQLLLCCQTASCTA